MKTKYSQNPGIGLIIGSFSATCFFTHAFIIHSFLGFSAFSSVVSAPSFFSSPSAGLTSFDSLSSSKKHKLVLRVRVSFLPSLSSFSFPTSISPSICSSINLTPDSLKSSKI